MPTNLGPVVKQFDRCTGRWRERDPLDDLTRLMPPWTAAPVPFVIWFALVGAMFVAAANAGRVAPPTEPPASAIGPS